MQGPAGSAVQSGRAPHHRPPVRGVRSRLGGCPAAARRRRHRVPPRSLSCARPRLLHTHRLRDLSSPGRRLPGCACGWGTVRRPGGGRGMAGDFGRGLCQWSGSGHRDGESRWRGGDRGSACGSPCVAGRRVGGRGGRGGPDLPGCAIGGGRLRGQEPQGQDAIGQQARHQVGRAAQPAGSEKPAMATGEIEVEASEVVIITRSKTPPFPIEDDTTADESVRLKYRYLDLRRPRMQRILELRHRVNKIIHAYMDEHEFIEVETPLLVKGTPEGARDFIVPSRLHIGDFFALPQSPQQLKQLLMVSGLGRYYQIARCLRDEDLRADRALEFTQLDLEMSFCDEEDVFTLIEGLWARIWKQILDVDLVTPFPRIDMQDSLLRYGTDKPDLRPALQIAHLTTELP